MIPPLKNPKPNMSTLRALEMVLEYNWEDEERDFEENPCAGHIYLALIKIRNEFFPEACLYPEE